VLERLATLPISTWTYGFDHESVRHLGPMAQDFASTFGLGYTDRQIAIVDANGVCMAAVQALHRRVVALEAELAKPHPQGRRVGDRGVAQQRWRDSDRRCSEPTLDDP